MLTKFRLKNLIYFLNIKILTRFTCLVEESQQRILSYLLVIKKKNTAKNFLSVRLDDGLTRVQLSARLLAHVEGVKRALINIIKRDKLLANL